MNTRVRTPTLIAPTFRRDDSLYSDPQAIVAAQKIAGGCLISMAHLYASDDFAAIEGDDEQRLNG